MVLTAAGEAVLSGIASSGRCGQDSDIGSLEADVLARLRLSFVDEDAEVVCSTGSCDDAGDGIREIGRIRTRSLLDYGRDIFR